MELGAATKVDITLLAYEGTSVSGPVVAHAAAVETMQREDHTAPTVDTTVDGNVVLSYWADKTSATTT